MWKTEVRLDYYIDILFYFYGLGIETFDLFIYLIIIILLQMKLTGSNWGLFRIEATLE